MFSDTSEVAVLDRPASIGDERQTDAALAGVNVCLFSAAPDTSNLGVSALCYSTLAGIARRLPEARITVFDNGWGVRDASIQVDGGAFHYQLSGGRRSRRFYRPESYWNMRASWRVGMLWNKCVRAVADADAVLDVSGGDSFCDLYGPRVFKSNTALKQMALEHGKPLILLPQTYGPFEQPESRKLAEQIVRNAHSAWARDARSFDALRDLLGGEFDPTRHFNGVDLAFGLDPADPGPLPSKLASWLGQANGPELIGFNVSGLIYNDPESARSRYKFKADYRQVVLEFLKRVLARTDARIVLVPHVLAERRYVESDFAASDSVVSELGNEASERVEILPTTYDPGQVKSVIAQTNWFCGTRMHATIAALSSGVPTAAIAYSLKTAGVFETCAQGDRVADPRALSTEETVDHLWNSLNCRKESKISLASALPGVQLKARRQMDQLSRFLSELKEQA